MDLSRKLERLDRARAVLASYSPKPPAAPARVPPSALGREALDLARGSAPAAPRFRRIETTLEPDHHHGKVPIAGAIAQPAELFAELALDPALAAIDLSKVLFLDTETTGLSGGTGTLAFLIGLARFVDQSLVIEQLLLAEPGEERRMLELLSERVAEASCLVTFNGKTFDWPLLSTRLVLQRLPPPPPPPHLDLLHCARRVYKRRLREVRLVRLEEEVLGMRRERDVDGFEIPGLYWTFVRSGREAVIAPVVEHNANDLVALAAMMVRMGERFAAVCAGDDPIDHYSMAVVAMKAGDRPRAVRFAAAAAEGGGPSEITVRAHELLARIDADRGEVDLALARLKRALDAARGDIVAAARVHLKLAKLYEHKKKDLPRALAHATFTAAVEGREAHAKRLRRIAKRLH